jgi:hypothetical protein
MSQRMPWCDATHKVANQRSPISEHAVVETGPATSS